MIRTREYKYVQRHPDGPDELWDLVNDPDERENRIGDPALAGTETDLRATLADWFARYVIPEKDGNNVTHDAMGQPVAGPVG